MRTTIVLEDSLFEKLKTIAPKRKFSRFINQLIEDKVREIEKKTLSKEMEEGYITNRKDRMELNKDWDNVLAEGWE